MPRTNYHFSKELLDRLKLAKKLTDVPIVAMIRKAIDEYLKRMGL